MTRFRLTKRAVLVAVGVVAGYLALTSQAYATEDHFCVNHAYAAHTTCSDYIVNNWDRVRIRYAGQQNDNVSGCVWMRNTSNGEIRGGNLYCGATWSSPTLNPFGHNYGDTFVNQYINFNSNNTNFTHTFTGWASNNQTDG